MQPRYEKIPNIFFFFLTKPIGMFLEGLGIQDVGWVSGCGTPVYPLVL